MRARFIVRLRILSGFFILIALLLIVRLYFVQVVHSDEYRAAAERQYVERAQDSDERGSIFFKARDGSLIAAAVMKSGWRVAISPDDIADPDSTFAELQSVVPLDRERFF